MLSAGDGAIADGLASIAITAFEMGLSEEDAEGAVLTMWERLLRPEGAFHAAAGAMARMPQPPAETAAEIARRGIIEARLGVTNATAQLEAMLSARALLERLHHEAA